MSYDEHYELAKKTRTMLEGAKISLIDIIDHNRETKPMPHHHNRDLMTTLLKMEQSNG
jgi:hypothetical protein